MTEYQLPKFKFKKPKLPKCRFKLPKFRKNKTTFILVLAIFLSSIFGFLAGAISGSMFYSEVKGYLSNFSLLEKIVEKKR